MYSCNIEITHDVHELRKTMATATQSLGQIGCKAIAGKADSPDLAVRILELLREMQVYSDTAQIFPTHLSGKVVSSHAERGLCTMFAPPSDGRVAAERQTSAGGLAATGLKKLRERAEHSPAELTEAQRLVLEHEGSAV